MQLLPALLVLFADLLLIAYVVWFISTVISMQKNPPLIRTRNKVVDEVVSLLGRLPNGSVFYELGAGDGRVVSAIAKANPGATCIGIERYYIPFFLSRFRKSLPNVSYRRADIFKTDLSDATHIYSYTYPNVMAALSPKLEKELKKGTRLITLDFSLPEPTPERVVDVSSRNALGTRLFEYIF